jgi:hypothetical protein
MKITKQRLQEIILEELNEAPPPSVLPQYAKEYTGKERRASPGTGSQKKAFKSKGKSQHQKDVRSAGETASGRAQKVGSMTGVEATADEMLQQIRDVLELEGTAQNLQKIMLHLKRAWQESQGQQVDTEL